MTLPIRTERLLLRRYIYSDIPDILSWSADPSVAGETQDIGTTDESVRQYIDRKNSLEPFQEGECFDLAIERKAGSKVIGMLTLICKEPRQGLIGWALGVDFRGQGYATEAARGLIEYGFSKLRLHRVQAETNSANVRSWQLMDRLGMRLEARLREASLKDGQWLDRLIYGVLAAEWSPPAS